MTSAPFHKDYIRSIIVLCIMLALSALVFITGDTKPFLFSLQAQPNPHTQLLPSVDERIASCYLSLNGTWRDEENKTVTVRFKDSMLYEVNKTDDDTQTTRFIICYKRLVNKEEKTIENKLYLLRYDNHCSRQRIVFIEDGRLLLKKVCLWDYCCTPAKDEIDDIRILKKM